MLLQKALSLPLRMTGNGRWVKTFKISEEMKKEASGNETITDF